MLALAFLPFLGFVRRLADKAIVPAGLDPLLLVGPVVAGACGLAALLVPAHRERLTGLALVGAGLALIVLAQSANPLGGDPGGNAASLLFWGAPLAWFFAGRFVLDDDSVQRLLTLLVHVGVIVAAYGVAQSQVGFPSWDTAWIARTGYDALNVGEASRSFASFPSSAEYGLWVASALVVAVTRRGWFDTRTWPIVVGVLILALVLSGTRGPLIFAAVALMAVCSLQAERRAWLRFGLLLVLTFGALKLAAPGLESLAARTGDDLVRHQLQGLADPTDARDSTLVLHLELVVDGLRSSLQQPWGVGTGATSPAAEPARGAAGATEVDFSNAFVSLGAVGGVLYLVFVAGSLAKTVRLHRRHVAVALPLVAVLIVNVGQWWTGGHYALSALIWATLGWLAARTEPGAQRGRLRTDARARRRSAGSRSSSRQWRPAWLR